MKGIRAGAIGALLALSGATAAWAAPSPSSVTLDPTNAGQTTATVNGGPITGLGDDANGHPLPTCQAPSCEQYTVTLTAPAGYTTTHVIKLTVDTSYDASNGGTLDSYIEDSTGTVLSSDPGSHEPSRVAVGDAQPGTYTMIIVGSVGANTSYQSALAVSSSTRVVGAIPQDISFAPSTVVSPVVLGGEPQVTLEASQSNSQAGAIDSNRGFIDWPLSSRTNTGMLYRTVNGGDSFRQLYDLTCAERQRPNCGTGGGGDTVNRVNFYDGHVLYGDQESLAAEAYAQSNDHGDSFPISSQQAVTAAGTGVDRQWIAAASGPGYTAGPVDTFALEGIFSYHIPLAGEFVSGIDTNGLVHPAATPNFLNVDQSGPSVIDTTGGPGNGWFYQSYRHTVIAGGGPSGYLVATVPVSQFETPSSSPTSQWHINTVNTDNPSVFPWITLDNQGNAYAAWAFGGDIFMAYSRIADRQNNPSLGGVPGTLWSTKVKVNPTALGSTIFPEIVAGDPGHVAITYDATTDFQGVSDNAAGAHWYTVATMTLDALDPAPTFLTGPVSHRVIHTGTICTSGTTCIASMGDRSLLDMIDLSVDSDGRVGVVYTNNNNTFARQEGAGPSAAGSQGEAYVMFSKLASGPSLRSGHGPYALTFGNQCHSSPAGDATWPNHLTGASNIPALDVLGDCLYEDASGNLVAQIDLADARVVGMVNGLNQYNAVTSTDVPAARVQYVERFETGNDVWYMAYDVDASGTERAYGGMVNQNNAITNGTSALGTTYDAQAGFTVTATRQGNSLILTAPMSQFSVNGGDTLYSATAFSDAGPTNTSLGGSTTDSTIYVIDRVVDATPPMDVVVTPLVAQTPEAPLIALVPLIGAAALAAAAVRRRRRAQPA